MKLTSKTLNILIIVLTSILAIVIIGKIRINPTESTLDTKKTPEPTISTIADEETPKGVPCVLPRELTTLKSHTYLINTTFTTDKTPETVTDTISNGPKKTASSAATLADTIIVQTKRAETVLHETAIYCESEIVWGFGVPLIVQEKTPPQAGGLSVIELINKAFDKVPYIPFIVGPIDGTPQQKDVSLAKGIKIHYTYFKKGLSYYITAEIPLSTSEMSSPLAGILGSLPSDVNIEQLMPSQSAGNSFTLTYTISALDYSLEHAELQGTIETSAIKSTVTKVR